MTTENNKYQININPKRPSKEEIRKKMDFDGAYKSYTHWVYRTPWHRFQRHASKNRKTTMMIMLFAIIATLVAIEWEEEPKNDSDSPATLPQIENTIQKGDSIQSVK